MKTYEVTGKHTYLPMGIVAVCLIVLLVLLAALYKELAPKSNAGEANRHHVSATFDTLEKEEEYKGMRVRFPRVHKLIFRDLLLIRNCPKIDFPSLLGLCYMMTNQCVRLLIELVLCGHQSAWQCAMQSLIMHMTTHTSLFRT